MNSYMYTCVLPVHATSYMCVTCTRYIDLYMLRSLEQAIKENRDFGLIWICSTEFEILELVDFGGVACSVEFVVQGGKDS